MLRKNIPIKDFIGFFKFRFLEFQKEFMKKFLEENNIDVKIDWSMKNLWSDGSTIEPLEKLFLNGYCLHFAKMLETAYPGGWICNDYRYGHVVYVYEKHIYDITGDITKKMKKMKYPRCFIPIECLPGELKRFTHNKELKRETEKEIRTKLIQIQKVFKHKLAWSVEDIMKYCCSKNICEIEERLMEYFKDIS